VGLHLRYPDNASKVVPVRARTFSSVMVMDWPLMVSTPSAGRRITRRRGLLNRPASA
jgi:hypothetical protein